MPNPDIQDLAERSYVRALKESSKHLKPYHNRDADIKFAIRSINRMIADYPGELAERYIFNAAVLIGLRASSRERTRFHNDAAATKRCIGSRER